MWYVDGGASLSAYGVAADDQYVYALCTTEVKRIDPATSNSLDVIRSGCANGDYDKIHANGGRVYLNGLQGIVSMLPDGSGVVINSLATRHLSPTFGVGMIAFGGTNSPAPSFTAYLVNATTLALAGTISHTRGVRAFSLLSATRALAVYLGTTDASGTPNQVAIEGATGLL